MENLLTVAESEGILKNNGEIILIFLFFFMIAAIILFLVVFVVPKKFKIKVKSFFSYRIRGKRRKEIWMENNIKVFSVNLASCLARLSSNKTGGIFVIEKNDSLQHWVSLGTPIESNFLPELAYTVFENKNSPLHDGAMIIKDWKIVSLSSYLPLTKKIVDVKYGARHRAGYGITEKTDAIAIVVSETAGMITLFHYDKTIELPNDPIKLNYVLYNYLKNTADTNWTPVRLGRKK